PDVGLEQLLAVAGPVPYPTQIRVELGKVSSLKVSKKKRQLALEAPRFLDTTFESRQVNTCLPQPFRQLVSRGLRDKYALTVWLGQEATKSSKYAFQRWDRPIATGLLPLDLVILGTSPDPHLELRLINPVPLKVNPVGFAGQHPDELRDSPDRFIAI